MGVIELRRMRQLEDKAQLPRRLMADLSLDKEIDPGSHSKKIQRPVHKGDADTYLLDV